MGGATQVDPGIKLGVANVAAGRQNARLVASVGELDVSLARAVLVDDLKFADVA